MKNLITKAIFIIACILGAIFMTMVMACDSPNSKAPWCSGGAK